MKKITFLLLLVIPLISFSQTKEKNARDTFEVSGNCEMCKKTIEKAALSIKGVKMAKWDIPSNQLSLIFNRRKVDVINIHNAIAKSGYSTSEIKAKKEDYNKLPMCCQY